MSDFKTNTLTRDKLLNLKKKWIQDEQETLYFVTDHIDNFISFKKSQFIIVQSLSSHGKTSFMLNLMHHFLTESVNLDKNANCYFFSWESNIVLLKLKLYNIFSKGKIIKYNPKLSPKSNQKKIGNYIILDYVKFEKILQKIEKLSKNKKFYLAQSYYSLEEIEKFIEINNKNSPEKKHVYFLDSFQTLTCNIKSNDDLHKFRLISKKLAEICMKYNAIIIASSQLLDCKSIYNPACLVIDIFNNSHPNIKDYKSKYKKPENEENMYLSIKTIKDRYERTIELNKKFELIEGDYISKIN